MLEVCVVVFSFSFAFMHFLSISTVMLMYKSLKECISDTERLVFAGYVLSLPALVFVSATCINVDMTCVSIINQ